MRVLLSIKPEYAEKILSGEKRFEFRKSIFRNPNVKTVVIYATMPVGMVIGEFEIDDVLTDDPRTIWELTAEFAGITKKFFNEYFRGRETAHAIKVKRTHRYHQPIRVEDLLPGRMPPQSFCYLH
jgi:predicted transcriptional regulator